MTWLITQALRQTALWSWGPLMKSLEKGLIGSCWLDIVCCAKVQDSTSGRSAKHTLLGVPRVGHWEHPQQITRMLTRLRNNDSELAIRPTSGKMVFAIFVYRCT